MLRSLRRLLGSVRKRIDALEANDRKRAIAAVNEFETAYDDLARDHGFGRPLAMPRARDLMPGQTLQ